MATDNQKVRKKAKASAAAGAREQQIFHGMALKRIVDHDLCQGVARASDKPGHYRVNGDRDVFLKYAMRQKNDVWRFTFAANELAKIKDAARRSSSHVCFICGNGPICVIHVDELVTLLDISSKSSQSISVEASENTRCHLSGPLGPLGRAIPRKDFPATLFSKPEKPVASKPYSGKSRERPKGPSAVNPAGVGLKRPIQGGARRGKPAGSGCGYVNLGLVLVGGSKGRRIKLPAGTSFLPNSPEYQNGLLLQDVTLEVPAGNSVTYLLKAYCANKERMPADGQSTYAFGPILHSPAIDQLIDMLRGVEIPAEQTELVQKAVWEATEQQALKEDTIRKLSTIGEGSCETDFDW